MKVDYWNESENRARIQYVPNAQQCFCEPILFYFVLFYFVMYNSYIKLELCGLFLCNTKMHTNKKTQGQILVNYRMKMPMWNDF